MSFTFVVFPIGLTLLGRSIDCVVQQTLYQASFSTTALSGTQDFDADDRPTPRED